MQINYEKKKKNPPLYGREGDFWLLAISYWLLALFNFFEVDVLSGGVATVGGVV